MNTFYYSTKEKHHIAIFDIYSHKYKNDSMTMESWNPGGLMGSKSV